MTRRRKLLILLAAVPVLFVTVALLYLSFADLSGWRDTVATLVSDAIGRELKISGEFAPEIGLSTRLVATNITLANPGWSNDPHMVSVDRLVGEIDLLSLVFGPITINDVEITGARVLFEVDTEGRFNWVFETDGSAEGDGGDVELVISHAVVNDLQLAYEPPREQALQAALAHLEITDDGTGMLDLDLDGSLDGTPLEISGRLGTFIGLINAAAVEHDLSGKLGDIEISTSGHIADLTTLGGADLTARVQGTDLLAVAELLDLPGLPGGAFQIDLGVNPATAGSDLEFSASVGAMTAEIAGTVDSLTEPGVVDVTVEASGPDVAVVSALTGVEGLPTEPFAVSGRVRWEGFPITCDNIDVQVGANTLSADGVLGAPPQMLGTDFTFEGSGPDISSLAGLAGLNLPKDGYSVGGRLVRLERGIGVEEIKARIGRTTLEVDGTVGDPPEYAGTALNLQGSGPNLAHFQDLAGVALPAEPFKVEGRLEQGDGAINLEAVRAHLGRNTLQVSGQLTTETGLAGTDLRLKVSGPDASQLAAIADVSEVPAEAFSVDGRIRVTENGYRLNDLAATLGSLAVKANGFVAPPPTLFGTDLQLHIEDPDLSHPASIAGITDLPSQPLRIDGRVRVDDAGYRLDGVTASAGDIEVEVAGLIGAASNLDGTQVHLTARGPRLSSLAPYLDQPGLPPAPFSIEGDLRVTEGAYELDTVVAEVEGNRVTVNGTVQPVHGLEGTDIEIEVSAPDLRQAGRLVTGFADLPELPDEPLTLTTRLAIDAAGYQIDNLEATLANARVTADGRVGPPPSLVGTDFTIEADGPDASLFKAFTGVTVPVAPFQINGRVERNEAGFRFHEVTARLGEYRAAIDGTLGELPKLIGTDLELHASGPSLALIGELAGLEQLPDHPFQATGRFKGTPELFSTDGLEITFGESDLRGSLEVDIRDKPAITVRVSSKNLDLAPYLPRSDSQEGPAEPTDMPGNGLLVSDDPIDFGPLQRADADVQITIGTLQLPLKRFRDVGVDLHLDDGRLEIKRLTAVGQAEGRMTGSLVLEPVGHEHHLRTRVSAQRLRLDLPGSEVDRADQPPIDIDIDLEARGATPHGLASSANGSLQVVIGKGVMDDGVLDFVTADILLTLLTAFNPFAKEDVATELQCGVMLATFENGLATLEPIAVQSDKMTMLGKGKIDFGTEKLDLEWVTKPRKGVGLSASMITNPYIKLGGTLAEPAVELKPLEAVASTSVAVATLGLSLVAKGMFDRVTAEKKVCKEALEEIGRQPDNTSKKSKKKQR